MSSWFSNPFKSLEYSSDDDDTNRNDDGGSEGGEDGGSGGGVKDDLSAIGASISLQFRGVAAFLAPPSDEAADSSTSGSGCGGGGGGGDKALAGIKSDLAEIGGTFKNSLSLFSSPNKAVSRISELASNFLQFDEERDSERFRGNSGGERKYNADEYGDDGDDDEEDELEQEEYGVTDQVIDFARQISNRPELWLDFPLSFDHEFHISDAQSEHASIVEQLVPSLADLRSRISKEKSENQFWVIYFILLLPRLSDDDLELLSTAEIAEAREKLLLMLRTKKNEEPDPENSQSLNSSNMDHKVDTGVPEISQSVGDVMTAKDSALRNSDRNESDSIEKLAGENSAGTVTSSQGKKADTKIDDPDSSRTQSNEAAAKVGDNSLTGQAAIGTDDHLKGGEEEPVPSRNSATASKSFRSEDDVSFSDLEDEDNDISGKQSSSGRSQLKRNSSSEGSTDWVQLNKNEDSRHRGPTSLRDRDSEGEESVDWLTVDDFDP